MTATKVTNVLLLGAGSIGGVRLSVAQKLFRVNMDPAASLLAAKTFISHKLFET